MAAKDENYYNTYRLVEMDQDAEIIQVFYEQKGSFTGGRGEQEVQAAQIDDYIIFSTYYWFEDVLSFCWIYNTKTGESNSIEM